MWPTIVNRKKCLFVQQNKHIYTCLDGMCAQSWPAFDLMTGLFLFCPLQQARPSGSGHLFSHEAPLLEDAVYRCVGRLELARYYLPCPCLPEYNRHDAPRNCFFRSQSASTVSSSSTLGLPRSLRPSGYRLSSRLPPRSYFLTQLSMAGC